MTPEADALALSLFARGLTLHLYQSLTGSEPVECDFPGYAPHELGDDYTSDATSPARWPAVTFTRTVAGKPQAVGGWFVMRGATRVQCVPFLGGGYTVSNKGDAVSVAGVRFERAKE